MEAKTLTALQGGSGKQLLLAFHGYGNDAGIFLPFEEYLRNDYTILSIDLPHHGKCEWPVSKLLEIGQLQVLVEELLSFYKLDKLSLLGYSMGGRVCMKIIELFPQQVDRTVLIAPDGLAFNPLYYFATRTVLGKRMFRKFLTRPGSYMNLVETARSRRWIDESRYKFAMQYLQAEESRLMLLKVWPCMSKIIPDIKVLRGRIRKHNIPVDIFMGQHDRIIPVSLAQSFKKDLDSVQIHILDKGHRLLDSATVPKMAECLLV